jgi:phosphate-selective porin OprO/OprP
MKQISKYLVMVVLFLSPVFILAQEPNTGLTIVEKNDLKISVGARLSVDGALYLQDYTPLKSGASVSDARIRLTIVQGKWDAYYDVDFGKGILTQKNAFVRYNFSEKNSIRLGYGPEPFSISYNTSQSDLHFISRSTPVNVLAPGRALGITFKHAGDKIFAEAGLFTENMYNKQEAGDQGYAASGRFLFRPVQSDDMSIHFGAIGRYSKIGTGFIEGEPEVFVRNMHLGSSLETNVDKSVNFIGTDVKWASEEFKYGLELLAVGKKAFVQGEFIGSHIVRDRPDRLLFENQLGGYWSWTTFDSWLKGNPSLTALNFYGGYVEIGYLLKGSAYHYDKKNALLSRLMDHNALELVGRYSFTTLNDIADGDVFWKGQNRFFPESGITDYPPVSTSIAGGIVQTITVGANYDFTPNTRLMLHYTHTLIDNYYFEDDNAGALQMRLQYRF